MRWKRWYWPKRQGPLPDGMKKALPSGSKSGLLLVFSMSPVVRMQGKHSFPSVYFLPIWTVSSSDSSHHLGVHAAGPESAGKGDRMVRHVGYVDLPGMAVRHEGRDSPLFGPRLRLCILDAVEEGLQAGDNARVSAVLVDLQLQEGFAFHDLLEEMGDERIGAAPEIGDIYPRRGWGGT